MAFRRTGYWAYLSLLCALLFVRDVLEVSVPLVVFLAYFGVAYLMFDYDQSLSLTAMLPLLTHGVQTNYVVIMAVVIYLYKYSVTLKINMIHALMAFLMILELLHMAIQPFSFSEYLRYLFQYAYFALIIGETRLKQLLKDPILVLRTYVFMAAYFMLDVLLVTLKYVEFEAIITGKFRLGVLDEFMFRAVSLNDNENMVGMFAMMAVGFLAVCMIKTKKHLLRDSLLILYFVYFGLLTQSKTFLICAVAMSALLFFYFMAKNRGRLNRSFWILIGGVLLAILAVNAVFKDAMTGVMQRFQADDLSTGRSDLFPKYNALIMKTPMNLFLGIGLQSVQQKSGLRNVPHNAFQETWVCLGIVGLLLMILLIISVLRRPRRYSGKKIPSCYFFPFICFGLTVQTMQFMRMTSIFNMMIPLFIAAYMGGLPDEEKSLSDHG